MIWTKDQYTLSDKVEDQDAEQIYALLDATYWGVNRSLQKVERFIAHSLCFSLFEHDKLVGFVRVVSDYATISWVADMVIAECCRGKSLGSWMMQCVMAHPLLKQTQFALQTKDAHTFYDKLGFKQRPMLMSTDVSYL